MSLLVLALGTALVCAGAASAFAGFRGFFAILPFWGGANGFIVGASLVAIGGDEPFLRSTPGWVGGVALGAVLAVMATRSWWGPIAVSAGSVGWMFGSAVPALFDSSPGGLTVIAALGGASVLAWLAAALMMPRSFVVPVTAVGGAASMAAGVALLLDWSDVEALTSDLLGAVMAGGWQATAVFVVGAIAGTAIQVATTRAMEEEVHVELAARRG